MSSIVSPVVSLTSVTTDTALIAVTGATGAVASRLAGRLADAGVRLRMLARDPARVPALGPQVEVRRASGYGAGPEMRAALEGCASVFLVPAAEAPDRVEQHVTAIDAAVAAGVHRIGYLSFIGASADSTFTLARDHWHTEQHTSDGHDGRTYDLTGPDAFSLAEAAELMGRITRRTVSIHDETDEEAFASRAGFGAPESEVRGWISSYRAIRAGDLAHVGPDVRTLRA
jgi:NAD(P)H dehydrogenase (quinone)